MVDESPMLMPSILNSIKKILQIPSDYDEYDADVIMFINGALNDVTDLGIGPENGFYITGPDETWDQFIGDTVLYEQVKTLIFLKVRLVFDPPQSGYAITAMEKQIEQTVWRLSVRRENAKWPDGVLTDVYQAPI